MSPQSSQGTSPVQQIHETIQQARWAWLDGQALAFAALFAPEGEFIVPGQRFQGQEAILQAFKEFAETHSVRAIEIRNLVVEGNRALVEWYWEEQASDTGQVTKAEDAIAIDFQGRHIRRWREYIDDKYIDDKTLHPSG